MTYIKDKPDSGKAPDIDAPTIQGNFATFDTVFAVNHLSMNDPNQKQGDHTTIIFQNQPTFPTLVENEADLLAHDAVSNAGTQPQLWVKIPKFLPNNTANDPMQLTYNQVNITGPAQYQSFLIGGYLIYMGSISGNSAANVKIATQITLVPAPTKILVAIATPNSFTTSSTPQPFDVSTIINNNSQFTINSNSNGSRSTVVAYRFTWVAIATV